MKLIDRRENSSPEEKGSRLDRKASKDLLGLMIQASNSSLSVSSSSITVNGIVEDCKSFFFAGKQTTSNLLTWTSVLLAMHPRWQNLARDEVLTVCGARDVPTKDNVMKLKTLGMILSESLRLYSPMVVTIVRAKIDIELRGYKIQSGTEILISIIAVHHDLAIWGNKSNIFDPNRFVEGVARATNHPGGFIPFGLAVRTCVGQNFCTMFTKL